MKLDANARRNLGAAALAWFLLILFALTGWFVVAVPLSRDILDNDLTLIYIGVRIGLEHGWSHIYSLELQHSLFTQLRPHAQFNDGERFLSPPPFAWLVLPLTVFGAASAVYAWLALSAASLIAAWRIAAPSHGSLRWIWLLGAFAWYPVLYSLAYAQPDLLIVLLAAAAWRLAESGRPYLAGVVLGLSVIKPQLTLALPLVLLAGGRWRVAVAWAATAGVLAVASLLVIGSQGFADYQSLLREAQGVINNRYYTLAYIVGPGTLSYVLQALVTAAAAGAAYLNRKASHGRLFALGLLATALGATYWHLQDYALLVPSAWLFWRDRPPAWQRWWLLVVVIGGELAWPLRPLPILLGIAVWFGFLLAPPPKTAPRRAPAAVSGPAA